MFRRQKTTKKLSADELKSKLYAHFDKTGSINQLRTQIRSQLASELFKIASSSTAVSEHDNKTELGNTLLPLQVCNWLVYDHLMRQGYQYTLSTFVSETNLPYPEKLLAVGDILALVGLDYSSSEYKTINDLYSTNNEKGRLHSLLLAIVKSLIFITDKGNQQIENVEKSSPDAECKSKLPVSEKKYVNQNEHSVLKESFNEKISRIKELNEGTSLESSYFEQLQSMREERDKEIQNLRRKLVQELERLHSQEQSFYLEIEQERREIRKERDVSFNEKEKLKNKEDLFLKEQEKKLEKKIRELEEVHATKLHSKEKEILVFQNELKEKEKKLGLTEFEMSTQRERFDSLKRELDDVNKLYKSVHEKYNSLLDENTNLVRKFESMSDYNILKDELAAKAREISSLQREIENLQRTAERDKKAYTETVTSLELKLKATEPKLHHVQKELNQAKETLHMEEALWHKEKKRLEQDSLTTKELYGTVLQRLEEQKQDINDLHQTIHILHYQLTSENTSHSSKSGMNDLLRTTPKVPFLPPKNNHYLKSNENNPISLSQLYREKSLSFTSDSRSRLNKLQRKADEDLDKYSLIYHTSFDPKMPSIKPSPPHNSHTFAYNMKLNQPSFTKNLANPSSSFQMDYSKSFLTLENLNLNHQNAPSFMYRNSSGQSSKTVTSAQIPFDGTKTRMNMTPIEHKNIYSETFPSHVKQTFKTSDSFKPSSVMNEMYDKYQENVSSRIDLNILGTRKFTDSFSNRTVETVLEENTAKDVPITKTVSTGATENTFKYITETAMTENTTNYPNALGVSPSKSFSLPSTSNVSSFLNTNNYSTELPPVISNLSLKDTTVSQIFSTPTNQAAPADSLKQHEASPVSTGSQTSLGPTNQTATADSLKQHGAAPIITEPQTSLGNTHQTAVADSLKLSEATPIITVPKTSLGLANQAVQDSLKLPEAPPIVVDLDAAWKRKTSLPTVNAPLFKNLSPLMSVKNFTSHESVSEDKAKQGSSTSNYPDSISSKTQEHSSTTYSETSSITKTVENADNISSSITYVQNTMKNSEQHQNLNEVQVGFSQSEAIKEGEFQNDNKLVLSDVSGTDEEIKEKSLPGHVQSVTKLTLEESLSELSEVHMSCGSEQEEQKEESDNW